MKRIALFLQTAVAYVISLFIAILPLSVALRLGAFIGVLLYKLLGSRRKIAIENLEKIDRDLVKDKRRAEEIIRESFINLGKLIIECIKVLHGFGKKILDRIEIDGIENFDNAAKKGKGIFIISGHCGNWELLALCISYKLRPLTYAVRAIDNPFVNQVIEKYRTRFGNTVIYKRGALKTIFSEIKHKGLVMMLIDQSAMPKEGVQIDFLGRPAWAMKSPIVIARRTGGTVLPAFIKRTPTGHKVEIHPEIELSSNEDPETAIAEDTRLFAGYVENYIRENPTQWYWVHRRWKSYKSRRTET
jgi:KDO2-lipid IV(A) lauroyltransferase